MSKPPGCGLDRKRGLGAGGHWYRLDACAYALNTTLTCLREYVYSGQLPCLRFGQSLERGFLIRDSDLESFCQVFGATLLPAPCGYWDDFPL